MSDRLPFDIATSAYHAHDDVLGEADGFTVARERAEYGMRGRSIKGNPLLTPMEQKWEAIADGCVFMLAHDDPAYCLAELHALVATLPTPHTARYLAEVGPKLKATIAARALNKQLTADERAARASLTK